MSQQSVARIQELKGLIVNVLSSDLTAFFRNADQQKVFRDYAKSFMNENFSDIPDLDETLQSLLISVVRLMKEGMNTNATDVLDTLCTLFDPTRPLYIRYGHGNNDSNDSSTETSIQDWRATISFADFIDVKYTDSYSRGPRWRKAQVIEESSYGKVKVTFPGLSDFYDEWIPQDSPDVSPPDTKSIDEMKWRMAINANDLIDCFDTYKVWFNATILDKRTTSFCQRWENEKIPEVLVAYRIYSEGSGKMDDDGHKFEGWGNRYDEWISVSSPRIQPLNSQAVGKNSFVDTRFDDQDDPVEDDIIAVSRSQSDAQFASVSFQDDALKKGQASSILVSLVNAYAIHDGFSDILTRLAATSPQLPVDNMIQCLALISKLSSLFSRRFANEYIPAIKSCVFNALTNCQDSELRILTRDKLDKTIEHLTTILCRLHKRGDVNEEMDALHLSLSLKLFRCQFMERKIQGLKMITDIVQSANRMANNSLNSSSMVVWIEQNRLVQEVFQEHTSIIERATDIVQLFSREKKLTFEMVDVMWKAMIQDVDDVDRVRAVIKIMNQVGFNLNADQLEVIADNVLKLPVESITEDILLFAKELTKYTYRPTDPALKVTDIFWRVIEDDSPFESKLRQFALDAAVDMYKMFNLREHRESTVYRCIDNIKAGRTTFFSIVLLKSLTEAYNPSMSYSRDMPTRQDLIMRLHSEVNLLQLLADEVGVYLKQSRSSSSGQKMMISHAEQLKTRLDALLFFVRQSPLKLPLSVVKSLWDSLVLNKNSTAEMATFLLWLKRVVDDHSSSSTLDDDVVPAAFSWIRDFVLVAKNAALSQSFLDLTESFSCIKAFFFMINKATGAIMRASSNDADFYVISPPQNLEGIDLIWHCAFESTSQLVGDEAAELLSRFYEGIHPNLSAELERRKRIEDDKKEEVEVPSQAKSGPLTIIVDDDNEASSSKMTPLAVSTRTSALHNDRQSMVVASRQNFIDHCMKKLKESTSKSIERSALRSISLLERLLDLTESFLPVSVALPQRLKSHAARIRGKKMKIIIENSIGGNKGEKKFDLIVNSNNNLWDVRVMIARRIGYRPERVGVSRRAKELPASQNSKTLSQIGLTTREETWKVFKVIGNEPNKREFLGKDGKMCVEMVRIVTDFFYKYAPDGYMTRECAARFIDSCVHDGCKAQDHRVAKFFTKYDDDKDDVLKIVDFLQLYQDSCKTMPEVVWQNLAAHGIRGDLKIENDHDSDVGLADDCSPTPYVSEFDYDGKQAQTVSDSLSPFFYDQPKFLLACNDAYFSQFMSSTIVSQSVSRRVWDLLLRIPSNCSILDSLLNLDPATAETLTVPSKLNRWSTIFDPMNPNHLLYNLQIVDSLVSPHHPAGTRDENVISWRRQFVGSSGLRSLFDVMIRLGSHDPVDVNNPHMDDLISGPSSADGWGAGERWWVARESESKSEVSIKPILREIRIGILAAGMRIVKTFVLGTMCVECPTLVMGPSKLGLWRQSSNSVDPLVSDKGFVLSHQVEEAAQTIGSASIVFDASIDDKESLSPTVAKDNSGEVRVTVSKESEFLDIMNQLSPNHNRSIVQMLDFPFLVCWSVETCVMICKNIDDTFASSLMEGKIGDVPFEDCGNDALVHCLELFAGLVLARPQLLLSLLPSRKFALPRVSDKNCVSIVPSFDFRHRLTPLLSCTSSHVRRRVARIIREICASVSTEIVLPKGQEAKFDFVIDRPTDVILRAMLEQIPDPNNPRECLTCYHFFDLLCALVADEFATVTSSNHTHKSREVINVEELADKVVTMLQDHKVVEESNKASPDNMLIGLMKLLVTLVTQRPDLKDIYGRRLIEHIWSRCLFAVPNTPRSWKDLEEKTLPICKTLKSREMAFTLLTILVTGSVQNICHVIGDCLLPLSSKMKATQSWNANPSHSHKNVVGYVGLKNLGNTCYMNSTLQQLYMIPSIRRGILSAPSQCAEGQEAESLIYQLQRVFSFLSLTDRDYFDPLPMIKTIKDMDGNPVDVSQQQDSQSFLLSFIDKIEEGLKGSKYQNAFKQELEGTMTVQMILDTSSVAESGDKNANSSSEGLDRPAETQPQAAKAAQIREKEEGLMCASLEVKNVPHLFQALDKYVGKDTITGFHWDDNNKEVAIQKRNVFGKLPNTLLFHLNRFTMNFDTFMTEKVNSRFEFPVELNMEPYTKEGITRREKQLAAVIPESQEDHGNGISQPDVISDNEDYYKFRLSGVVVHLGTADHGHYFSFIADREKNNESWVEFNDAIVREWSVSNLESDCFGGNMEVKEMDDFGWSRSVNRENIQNAYLLFYERINPLASSPPMSLSRISTGDVAEVDKSKFDDSKSAALLLANLQTVQKDPISEEQFFEVFEDNNRFKFDRDVFNSDFFNFISSASDNYLDALRSCVANDCRQHQGLVTSLVMPYRLWLFDLASGILGHAEYSRTFPRILEVVHFLFSVDNPQYSANLLEKMSLDATVSAAANPKGSPPPSFIRSFLLDCPEVQLRVAAGKFIYGLFESVANSTTERNLYGKSRAILDESEPSASPVKPAKPKPEKPETEASQFQDPLSEFGDVFDDDIDQIMAEINALESREQAAAEAEASMLSAKSDDMLESASVLERLFDSLIDLLEISPKYWTKFEQFFLLIEDICCCSSYETQMMLSKQVIVRLVDFILQKSSPFHTANQKRIEMGNSSNWPRFDGALRAICRICSFCGETSLTPIDQSCLTSEDRICLRMTELIEASLSHDQGAKEVTDFFMQFGLGDEQYAASVSQEIACGIDRTAYEFLNPWFAAIRRWVEVKDDGLQAMRVRELFGTDPFQSDDKGLIKKMWSQRMQYSRWYFGCLSLLSELMVSNLEVGLIMSNMVENVPPPPPKRNHASVVDASSHHFNGQSIIEYAELPPPPSSPPHDAAEPIDIDTMMLTSSSRLIAADEVIMIDVDEVELQSLSFIKTSVSQSSSQDVVAIVEDIEDRPEVSLAPSQSDKPALEVVQLHFTDRMVRHFCDEYLGHYCPPWATRSTCLAVLQNLRLFEMQYYGKYSMTKDVESTPASSAMASNSSDVPQGHIISSASKDGSVLERRSQLGVVLELGQEIVVSDSSEKTSLIFCKISNRRFEGISVKFNISKPAAGGTPMNFTQPSSLIQVTIGPQQSSEIFRSKRIDENELGWGAYDMLFEVKIIQDDILYPSPALEDHCRRSPSNRRKAASLNPVSSAGKSALDDIDVSDSTGDFMRPVNFGIALDDSDLRYMVSRGI